EKRRADGEGERGRIEADAGEERKIEGVEARKRTRACIREDETESGAARRERDAFGKELAHEAQAIGAEGSADGDFALAGAHTSELQIGQIGANDEHDDADGAGEDNERGAYGPADVRGERRDARHNRIAFGDVLLAEMFAKEGKFGLSASEGGAGR